MSGVVIEEVDSDEDYGTPNFKNEADVGRTSTCGHPVVTHSDSESGRSHHFSSEDDSDSNEIASAEGSDQEANEGGDDGDTKKEEEEVVKTEAEIAEEKKKLAEAESLKLEGNSLYSQERWQEALDKYDAAAAAAPAAAAERAVYLANGAAAALKLDKYKDAIRRCSEAMTLDPPPPLVIKLLNRRSQGYEKIDELDKALADFEKLAELEPGTYLYKKNVERLRPLVNKRHEEMKDEMIGKLKDLGNSVLGRFGLSVDNFKTVQDPQTGSYSIKFEQ